MTEPLVYLNGAMVPASQAHLAIYDAGVVLGATVTEQTRTFRHRLFRLDDHLDRLFRSLRYVRFKVGLTKEELAALSQELVAHNAQLLGPDDDLGLIHFVTAGEYASYAGRAGLPAHTPPTICLHTFPLPFERWAAQLQGGLHLVTPSIRQVPAQCWDPQMKCRSRMHYFLADKEAQLVDPQAAALLLDLDGNVTETAAANFLLVERGVLVSPPEGNILPGISRATVRTLAEKLGMPFVEKTIRVFNVLNADEAFVTSTPYCLLPVTKVNGVQLGEGRPGPLFRRLLEAWNQEAGLDIAAQILDGARRRTSV